MCCCAGANYYFITHLLCFCELQINNRTVFVTRARGPCAASHTQGLAPVFFPSVVALGKCPFVLFMAGIPSMLCNICDVGNGARGAAP